MGDKTGISWTDSTWNPWQGCLKVSAGCKQCYMYRDKERYGQDPKVVVRSKPSTFNLPLKWSDPRKIFTCSWSDWFIDQADEWRPEAWEIIKYTPQHTYQILTKRPENIADRLPENWEGGWSNVWLGVSVENPDYLFRIDELAKIPTAIRFVSYEPALDYVDFEPYADKVDWIISGGESGSKPRPYDMVWFKAVKDMCFRNNIAFFHKQHGGSKKIEDTWGGCLIDGLEYKEFPNAR